MEGRVKYYFKKPKGAIAKDILVWLVLAGAVTISAQSPYFVRQLLRRWKEGQCYKLRSKEVAFWRMRKAGLLNIERKGSTYRVSLTENGRKQAGWLQLDALEVKNPGQWKGFWYFLLFDIAQVERWKRDVLRSFLERLQFVFFQRSVWVHAHDCRAELQVLEEFLGLTAREIKLVVIPDSGIDKEDSQKLRKYFRIL